MTATLARAVVTIAAACLGERRCNWAMAMQSELDSAIDDGKPLVFAIGCLWSAVREMPAREEGRFTLTSHAVALGLLPVAALLMVGTTAGFPFLPSGHAGIAGWLAASSDHQMLLTPWNRGFAPALALLIWGIIAGHLLMPWFVLERDWIRVATLARINSAATVTLFLFTGVLFLDVSFMLLPAAGLAIELIAIWHLHRWHAHVFAGAPPGPPAA